MDSLFFCIEIPYYDFVICDLCDCVPWLHCQSLSVPLFLAVAEAGGVDPSLVRTAPAAIFLWDSRL